MGLHESFSLDNSWDVSASRHSDLASLFFSLASSLLLARGAFYQDIKARSVAWKTGGVYSTKVGSRPGNAKKNRYKDVVPCKSLGIFRESGPLAQTLGGSARVTAATHCPAPTAPQSSLPPVLEADALLLEATRGRFLPVFRYLACFCLGSTPLSICLTHWQMMRPASSFPCCRRRDMEITSMPTSSGSG